MTKKWKCISIRPPLRCVKIAKQDMSPSVARTSRERLVNPDSEAPPERDDDGRLGQGTPNAVPRRDPYPRNDEDVRPQKEDDPAMPPVASSRPVANRRSG